MKLKTIKQLKNLKNKSVLLRVDFNCPVKNGKVVDETRIQKVLPTIKHLFKQKARVILISHFGRPQGKKDLKYSLKPIAEILKKELKNFYFLTTPIGLELKKQLKEIKTNSVVLLENIRFYPQEEKNCSRFAKKIASLADVYVNDAFAVCHRAHSSVAAITKYLPSYAGFLLTQEIKELNQVLKNPSHPFIVLMGGKKIITKIKPIKNLLKKAEQILVGGALASGFFKAAGYAIGQSFYEPEMIKKIKPLLEQKKIVLPFDVIVKSGRRVFSINVGELKTLKKGFQILDIGPETIKNFEKYLKSAKIIIWNGPLGYFEDTRFSQGSRRIAEAILKNKKTKIIIGGGDTIAALKHFKIQFPLKSKRVFISSGGGAMLEFLAGKDLPGIKRFI